MVYEQALETAAEKGHLDVIEVLVANGGKLTNNLLNISIFFKQKDVSNYLFLQRMKADKHLLVIMMKQNNLEWFKYLINRGIKIDLFSIIDHLDYNQGDYLDVIFDDPKKIDFELNKYGQIPLVYAAFKSESNIFQILNSMIIKSPYTNDNFDNFGFNSTTYAYLNRNDLIFNDIRIKNINNSYNVISPDKMLNGLIKMYKEYRLDNFDFGWSIYALKNTRHLNYIKRGDIIVPFSKALYDVISNTPINVSQEEYDNHVDIHSKRSNEFISEINFIKEILDISKLESEMPKIDKKQNEIILNQIIDFKECSNRDVVEMDKFDSTEGRIISFILPNGHLKCTKLEYILIQTQDDNQKVTWSKDNLNNEDYTNDEEESGWNRVPDYKTYTYSINIQDTSFYIEYKSLWNAIIIMGNNPTISTFKLFRIPVRQIIGNLNGLMTRSGVHGQQPGEYIYTLQKYEKPITIDLTTDEKLDKEEDDKKRKGPPEIKRRRRTRYVSNVNQGNITRNLQFKRK